MRFIVLMQCQIVYLQAESPRIPLRCGATCFPAVLRQALACELNSTHAAECYWRNTKGVEMKCMRVSCRCPEPAFCSEAAPPGSSQSVQDTVRRRSADPVSGDRLQTLLALLLNCPCYRRYGELALKLPICSLGRRLGFQRSRLWSAHGVKSS